MSASDPKEEWRRLSAEKCCCNNSCSCCTLTGCGLCVLILWIIFGAFGAYSAYASLQLLEDGTFVTPVGGCCEASGNVCWGECCVGTSEVLGYSIAIQYQGMTCDEVEPFFTITMIDNILSVVAGVCGVIGICGFIACMLLVPLAYSIIAIVLSAVIMFSLGDYDNFNYYFGFIFSALIVYLFFMNWKIMRDAQKGGW
eukprot:842649_1